MRLVAMLILLTGSTNAWAQQTPTQAREQGNAELERIVCERWPSAGPKGPECAKYATADTIDWRAIKRDLDPTAPAPRVESLHLVPPAPKLPRGLPLAQRVAGGVMVPTNTAHALHVYVVEWEHYPEQAQVALDALAAVKDTECTEQRRVDAAQAALASDQRSASAEAHRLTLGRVLGIGAVAAILGAVATLIATH